MTGCLCFDRRSIQRVFIGIVSVKPQIKLTVRRHQFGLSVYGRIGIQTAAMIIQKLLDQRRRDFFVIVRIVLLIPDVGSRFRADCDGIACRESAVIRRGGNGRRTGSQRRNNTVRIHCCDICVARRILYGLICRIFRCERRTLHNSVADCHADCAVRKSNTVRRNVRFRTIRIEVIGLSLERVVLADRGQPDLERASARQILTADGETLSTGTAHRYDRPPRRLRIACTVRRLVFQFNDFIFVFLRPRSAAPCNGQILARRHRCFVCKGSQGRCIWHNSDITRTPFGCTVLVIRSNRNFDGLSCGCIRNWNLILSVRYLCQRNRRSRF